MLILTRKVGESVLIGDDISITVLSVRGNQVKLGVQAPKEVSVHREEELLDGSCSGYVHECSFLHLFHPRAGVPRQPAEQQDSGRHSNLQYRSGVPDRHCIRGTAARTVHPCDQEARRKEICLNIIALLQPAVPLCGRLRPSITIIAG